ncbi:MAG: hypothetical protein ABIG93_04575 [archaeon]|nr:hypothetical protein [Nanoarchaeota archaeon]
MVIKVSKQEQYQEVADELHYDVELVKGLMEEGHNVYYLDAIVKVGLVNNIAGPYEGSKETALVKAVKTFLTEKGVAFTRFDYCKEISVLGETVKSEKRGKTKRNKKKFLALEFSWEQVAEGNLKTYLEQVVG